jgi:DNA-binding MarR family transcriptional regulator
MLLSYYDDYRHTWLVVNRQELVKTQRARRAPSDSEYAEAASLREALRRFQRRSEGVTHANGLTPRTYQLLLMIKTARGGNERAGLAELEKRLQLGRSTVTELVLRSEQRGLVRRELDRDRRRGISIRLTPLGERKLAGVVAQLGDERHRLVEILAELQRS